MKAVSLAGTTHHSPQSPETVTRFPWAGTGLSIDREAGGFGACVHMGADAGCSTFFILKWAPWAYWNVTFGKSGPWMVALAEALPAEKETPYLEVTSRVEGFQVVSGPVWGAWETECKVTHFCLQRGHVQSDENRQGSQEEGRPLWKPPVKVLQGLRGPMVDHF